LKTSEVKGLLSAAKGMPGPIFMPIEQFGLKPPEMSQTTIRAAPSTAAEFGLWLRSLYRLLREASQCETEDELFSTASRILSESVSSARVRFMFEAERPAPDTAPSPENRRLVIWTDPRRQSGTTTRVLDARLARMRGSLIDYARSQGVAILSADVASDERAKGAEGGEKEKDGERSGLSLVLVPLISGRETLGFVAVERSFRSGAGVKQLNGGPFTRAHLEFVAAAAYPLAARLGEIRRTQHAVQRYERLLQTMYQRYEIIGQSPALTRVLQLVERVAQAHSPALILGESGTGKELVARAIHGMSPRASGPFVPVNCAALPEGLVESELFGHARGAFTGAVAARAGCFELASGGTLFLDEIGDLPLSAQSKLLRVVQEAQVTRVGENRLRDVDCRIVAATNRDLAADVKAGRFREDLYYRLNVVDIALPPLRERTEDLPSLCRHILKKFGAYDVDERVLKLFARYRWPGNIRELRNTLERMAVLARPEARRNGVILLGENDVPLDIRRSLERTPAHRSSDGGPDPVSGTFRMNEMLPLAQMQVEYAQWVLRQLEGNKSKAARTLGIQRSTLYSWTEWEKDNGPDED
jgi:transcriptional regulator with GAF, ATPase, and Fis domain